MTEKKFYEKGRSSGRGVYLKFSIAGATLVEHTYLQRRHNWENCSMLDKPVNA